MNQQPIPADSAFAPESGFNIAAAFPVTDDLVRKVSRAKWQARLDRLQSALSQPGTLLCLTAGVLGLLAIGRRARR